jgi:probable phosphoglycerate mutase
MGRLILVRHGKTVLNSLDDAERLRGWMDIPLNEEGFREAQYTAKRIAQHRIQTIYCSDLCRAQQTGEAVVRTSGAPIIHTAGLRPWNLGTLAGQRVKDILPILKQLEVNPKLPAPGGESFLDFFRRYSRCLRGLLKAAARSSSCIVAVTHVRNLLATPTIIEAGDPCKIPVRGGPKTGSLMWLRLENSQWQIHVEEGSPGGDLEPEACQ